MVEQGDTLSEQTTCSNNPTPRLCTSPCTAPAYLPWPEVEGHPTHVYQDAANGLTPSRLLMREGYSFLAFKARRNHCMTIRFCRYILFLEQDRRSL